MNPAAESSTRPGILLVDDGELDGVARVLDEEGVAYERLRGGLIPNEIPPPRDLLIVTPRRVERVRRGSPPNARPGRPLRIIAVDEDSPAMRRRLRRSGLHLLIRQPAEKEIWRLLIARALYRGSERREDPRVAVGSPVEFHAESASTDAPDTVLVDLSNRGCRLQTNQRLTVGDPVSFTIPPIPETGLDPAPLSLRGSVRRLVQVMEGGHSLLAVVFDEDMEESKRTRLTTLINHWASGPQAMAGMNTAAPPLPACQLPTLPDLTLDDETDPPIASEHEVIVQLSHAHDSEEADFRGATEMANGAERRRQTRAQFVAPVVVDRDEGPFVLIGRDLSAGGMRIERHPDLSVGDCFRLALRGPAPGDPFVVRAEITRDDGDRGYGLAFEALEPGVARELEKMVACLPDVESLEDGELAGLGAILSEIIDD